MGLLKKNGSSWAAFYRLTFSSTVMPISHPLGDDSKKLNVFFVVGPVCHMGGSALSERFPEIEEHLWENIDATLASIHTLTAPDQIFSADEGVLLENEKPK